jgi:DNA mismatch endonuclease, patch repair protein
LRKLKIKYSRNVKSLSGQPGFVIPLTKKVIFVHGCYWHRHNCKKGRSMPATRKNFWQSKFKKTIARDKRNLRKLRKEGWVVLVVWECQVKGIDGLPRLLHSMTGKSILQRLRAFLE